MNTCRRIRKRHDTGLVRSRACIVTAVVLFSQGVSGQKTCALPELTLSTNCGNACAPYAPCLAYQTSACPSTGSCIRVNDCAVQCYTQILNDPTTFTFFVTFTNELENELKDDRARSEVEAKTLRVDKTFAFASNEMVSYIGALSLQPTVTSLIVSSILKGGSSLDGSVKSKVGTVNFRSNVISTQLSVTHVVLNNVDLSSFATLDQLPVILPSIVQHLSLVNTLLAAFPTLVANFSSLQTLRLDKNYITEVAATAAFNSLEQLSLADNDLETFRAVFPHLTTLDLRLNKLTGIPASIFIHDDLTELLLKGNPLASPWFTHAQTSFLSNLTTFDLENSDFLQPIAQCHAINRRTVHSLIVCISDTNMAATTTGISASTLNVAGIVGASIGGVTVLGLVICTIMRFHRNRVQKHTTKGVRESYFGGLSPPLTRSPGDKGYRGGRRTPVTGGPRIFSDYECEDTHESPQISTRSLHSSHSSCAYSLWNDDELLSLQVQYDEIEDLGTIASGAFGIIWLVKYRGTQLLASKRLRQDQLTKQRTQAFIEEIKLVAPLSHVNIVRLVGCAWTIESNLQALFEYMETGDLRDYLVDPTSPRHWSQEVLQIAVDIIEALVYVHSFTPPLVHRDLKSRNVLLTAELRAKVTDFGTSRYKSVDDTMTANVGTCRWLAPEVITGSSNYDQSVDIFSFGIVLSELDTHLLPYENMRNLSGNCFSDIAILQLVATGQLSPQFGASCPPELHDLAKQCLEQDPTKRPRAHVVAYELREIQRSLYTLL
ncbi:hypothetical protein CCR75_002197 [Bremia lactucae]|uniref:Protein kinase domain-containing protein n=1 Tax=Bremia lactucae TaxID=4779 RepID=A0A976IF91_BRELC|nr:hypothetical protein CCR75_002197 [Bremia lactucae]